MTRVFSCNSIASYIYVHNDIDQVLARQAVVKINFPDCREEPASNKVILYLTSPSRPSFPCLGYDVMTAGG